MGGRWEKESDEQLANEAELGLRGQGSLVEAMRRLRQAIVAQQDTTNRLTWALIFLGGVQILLLGVQIWRQFWGP